jgi:hypothetical protein
LSNRVLISNQKRKKRSTGGGTEPYTQEKSKRVEDPPPEDRGIYTPLKENKEEGNACGSSSCSFCFSSVEKDKKSPNQKRNYPSFRKEIQVKVLRMKGSDPYGKFISRVSGVEVRKTSPSSSEREEILYHRENLFPENDSVGDTCSGFRKE